MLETNTTTVPDQQQTVPGKGTGPKSDTGPDRPFDIRHQFWTTDLLGGFESLLAGQDQSIRANESLLDLLRLRIEAAQAHAQALGKARAKLGGEDTGTTLAIHMADLYASDVEAVARSEAYVRRMESYAVQTRAWTDKYALAVRGPRSKIRASIRAFHSARDKVSSARKAFLMALDRQPASHASSPKETIPPPGKIPTITRQQSEFTSVPLSASARGSGSSRRRHLFQSPSTQNDQEAGTIIQLSTLEISAADLVALLTRAQDELPLLTRTAMLQTYNETFTALELATWLYHRVAVYRPGPPPGPTEEGQDSMAWLAFGRLIDLGLVECCASLVQKPSVDDSWFYRFTPLVSLLESLPSS